MTPDIQYIESIKKGDTVTYGDQRYRVQDDGKGWLHIVVNKKKIALKEVLLFKYGTLQDYIFNGWYEVYPNFEMFASFAQNDKSEI